MPAYFLMHETIKHPETQEVLFHEGQLCELSSLERADLEVGTDCFKCSVILASCYSEAVKSLCVN